MSSSISKLVYAHAGAASPGRQNVWRSVAKGMPAPMEGCGTREHRMQVRGLPLSSRVSLALHMGVRRVKGCFQSTRRAPSFPELLTGLLGFLVLPGVKGLTNTHLVNTPCGLPLENIAKAHCVGLTPLCAVQGSRQCTWRRLNLGGIHRSVAKLRGGETT